MKNHLKLTCNHLLRVHLGRATYRRLYHQLYKVNGTPDNSVILQCRNQVIIKGVAARVSTNTIVSK